MACKRLDTMVGTTSSCDVGSRGYNTQSVILGNALITDPIGGSTSLSERSLLPYVNALGGGSGDTITSGNVSTGNVSNANGGNVIDPTNTEFVTQPPSDIQSPTSYHIPSASGRGLVPPSCRTGRLRRQRIYTRLPKTRRCGDLVAPHWRVHYR